MADVARRAPLILALAAAVLAASPAPAESPAGQGPAAPVVAEAVVLTGLWQYEGTYALDEDRSVDILAHEGRLYAVIDEVKHPLTEQGGDVFATAEGETFTFYRLGPLVRGFTRDGERHERRTRLMNPESRDLLTPRPARFWRADRLYAYQAPENIEDGVGMGEAAPFTLEPAVVERIVRGVEDGTWPEVHAVLVSRRDRLVMEEYFYGYHRERPHPMRELTEGVIAMAVGAAIEARMIPGADAAVAPYMRYRGRRREDPRREKITLAHLLSMRSGVDCDDARPGSAVNAASFFDSEDWGRTFMQAPMVAEPGAKAARCTAGVIVAGRVVERASQKRMRQVAGEHLFRPLGIDSDDFRWPFLLARKQAHQRGEVWLRPRHMMKLGLMLKDDGRWLGKPVLSEEWVQGMTGRYGVVDGEPFGFGVRHRTYEVATDAGPVKIETLLMHGDGGQNIWVVRDLDLVVVTTGGAYGAAEAPADRLLAEVILPAILNADKSARPNS
ncbi:MAG TPA: serine hydrolase [Caulobacteraceae bacterium]|nr:serine hydrolase [Caulobacteraceae bacterium]